MTWLRHVRFTGPVGKITRRLTSIVLVGFALTLFFGGLAARQLELAGDGDSARANLLLTGGIVLAVVCILATGLLRIRWGITLGWVVFALSALSTILLTPMGILTLLFGALWVLALVQGASMEQMTRDWIAEHGDVHPDDRPATPERPATPDRARGDHADPPTERVGEGTTDPTGRVGESTTDPTERAGEDTP